MALFSVPYFSTFVNREHPSTNILSPNEIILLNCPGPGSDQIGGLSVRAFAVKEILRVQAARVQTE